VEILVAFAVFYFVVIVAWRIVAWTLRALGDILRMLTWPLLWLAHRQALQAQRHRQRARTMQELRELALPPGGGVR
jgi:protein-S-isoprenylcysteine O-methyltransferase Ste14